MDKLSTMADQDSRWGLISAGRESRMNFFSWFTGKSALWPYDWEGGGGREGRLETAVYGKRRMRVKNLFIYFLFFFLGGGVSRRLYRFGSWNWKW